MSASPCHSPSSSSSSLSWSPALAPLPALPVALTTSPAAALSAAPVPLPAPCPAPLPPTTGSGRGSRPVPADRVAPPHAGSGAARAIAALGRRALPLVALAALVVAVDGSWATAQPAGPSAGARASQRPPAGAARPTGPITAPTAAATAAGADDDGPPASSRGARGNKKEVTGKLNLNTATEEQLLLLPTVGPSKAERIVAWRKRNGAFKRVADLRRVKGFGYKTFKRLEPYLAIQGDTTLAAKQ